MQRIAQLSPENRELLRRHLEARAASRAPAAQTSISREPRPSSGEATFPISFAQERLWFLEQLEPGTSVYNLSNSMRLQGPLDVRALEASLQALIQRHESLRTTFPAVEGQPVQRIAPSLSLAMPVHDLRGLPEGEREAEALRLGRMQLQEPFDLTRGPLLRTSLVQLGEGRHILLTSFHHIISDGWSLGLFWQELGRLYRASPLTAPTLQYGDFAVWQRAQEAVLERQLAYWKKQMEGNPAPLDLPTDRPRRGARRVQGARHSWSISAELCEQLKDLCRQEGATLFMLLLATLKSLLMRLTGQSDILVGTPIANRNREELEGIFGLLVNTLVLRSDVSGRLTFRQFLAQVRETTLAAYAHQDLPFERLVLELRPERDLSRTPLFQLLLALHNLPDQSLQLSADVSRAPYDLDKGTVQLDLAFHFWERRAEGGLEGILSYATDLFEAASMERLAGQFQTLLAAVVTEPDCLIAELPLLTEQERRQFLEWNETAVDYPRDKSVSQLFEEQVERTPDSVALVFEQQRLSYRELNERANQLAHMLRQREVGPGHKVAILSRRTMEAFVAQMAVLKVGAAFLWLDPKTPQALLQALVQDARPLLILADVPFDLGAPSLPLKPSGNYPSTNLNLKLGGEALAYLLYTSGSTGIPKGVLGRHQGILNRIFWMQREYPYSQTDVCCQKTSLSFVDSVAETFEPLLHGRALVVMADEVVLDPNLLVAALAEHRVTRIVLVPSLLRALLQVPDAARRLPELALWVSSGEPLRVELVDRFHKAMPGKTLLNLYGSTEVSADVTWCETRSGCGGQAYPIGRPLANTQVYVFDRQRLPVPVGFAGEFYIGGAGLAAGYWNRPDLTAERFVVHPDDGRPLYRTGDLGRWRPDGQLECLGRLDQQVKLRGFRIEPGEIETVLSEHPQISQSVVVLREDRPDEPQLVAYYVPAQGLEPETSALKSYLRSRLPGFMVPAAIVRLDELPLKPNGKVDRQVLPAPRELHQPGGPSALPQDFLEVRLLRIWQKILDSRSVGIDANFFDLGGHSLMAVRLIAEVEARLGRKLPLASLFEAPTVRLQAALLRDGWIPAESPLVPIQPHGSRIPLFLVHGLGGEAMMYATLSRLLGLDQPVYGLQAAWSAEHPPDTLEELAAHYLVEVRKVWNGPFRLGGLSLGGVVALEMAQQLIQPGIELPRLFLIDSYAALTAAQWQTRPGRGTVPSPTLPQKLKFHLQALRQLAPARRLPYAMRKLRGITQPPPPSPRSYAGHVLARLYGGYEGRPYAGDIVLFSCSQRPEVFRNDPSLGWSELATGKLEIRPLSGFHGTMLVEEPVVYTLVAQLRELL